MKIFFIMRHQGYIRNYESVIIKLAQRGHKIHLGFTSMSNKTLDNTYVQKLTYENSHITYSILPEPTVNIWTNISIFGRTLIDFMRYLYPIYNNSFKLRFRYEKRVPPLFRTLFRRIHFLRRQSFLKFLNKCLRILEIAIPCNKEIDHILEKESPDIVLFTPIVDSASSLLDYLKSSKKLGVKTCLCVASWDNLTNKGLIQIEPDMVIVWNEIQKNEAVELHNIQASKIRITGAQLFDQWFEMTPSTTKEEFCRKIGINEKKPFILYVCSSVFIARNEVEFIQKWIEQIRNSPQSKLREIGIVIRPHPNNTKQWINVKFSNLKNISIWPPHGAVPIDEKTKADYFDSLYHCSAVVGVNTSALIEAGIVGKPVLTILAPEFKDTQEGTLHFHYLVKGGLLHVSKNFKEHLLQLNRILTSSEELKEKIIMFIENFVRPHGLGLPCTPIVISAIEDLGTSLQKNAFKMPLWLHFVRIITVPLAFTMWVFNLINKRRTFLSKSVTADLPHMMSNQPQAFGAPTPMNCRIKSKKYKAYKITKKIKNMDIIN